MGSLYRILRNQCVEYCYRVQWNVRGAVAPCELDAVSLFFPRLASNWATFVSKAFTVASIINNPTAATKCNTTKETTILKNALSVIRHEHNLRLYYKHVVHRATAHVRTKSGSGPTLHYAHLIVAANFFVPAKRR